LEENERSVLISALLARLYDEEEAVPDEQALRGYYEQNKDRLRLTEPFVRVRYLMTESEDSALAAVALMESLDETAAADSSWRRIARRFTVDSTGASTLSSSFYPEGRILSTIPGISAAIEQLAPGQVISPFEMNGRYHVIQLIERLSVGALPEMPLMEEQLRARIAIENRKQLYARQVQRLRNEALAREELVVRD
jgi:parvulin-like peptidyl-prolyl isomerase